MKIAYIYPTIATKGGVERILVEKMNHLAQEKGYEVFLLTYDQGAHEVSFPLDERVRHIDLQVRTFVQYQYGGLRRLWEWWRRRRWLRQRLLHQLNMLSPDVIVTTTNGEVTLLNSLRAGLPLVVESHGGFHHTIDYEQDTWKHRLDIRWRYREILKADAVICLTNADAGRWRGHGFRNVHVIPNIAHLNPTDLLSDCNGKRALFVGRFAKQKGIPELLDIWEMVHLRYPDWTLEMYGENYEQYKECVREGICLHAPTSDIFSKYCKGSMLLLTSRWEPFGLVIPEAMSCGLSVVSFEGDGPCEIINDGVDGYIIKNRNKDEFADKVCKLIENVELRQQLGKNAIQKAQRYSADNIMPMWKELFDSLKKEKCVMANWYDKYMSIYGKPFSEVPEDVIQGTRERLAALQSPEPLASIVVIGYNEEKHLQACLWAISEIRCKYPVEIIGVDNDSKDRTAEIYEKSGIPYYTEYQHSCGYARRCGLQHAKGRFYFDVDSDTLYPPQYYEIMLDHLLKPGVSCVSATWSYFPDENHSKLSLRLFEMARDLFLWIQHFKRPELSVRGLVFAYNADYGRKEPYRVDIIRGEDGSMALNLKKYGKIVFVRDRRCRAITGYGTIGNQSMWQSFCDHVRIQMRGITRIFHATDHYDDAEDNLVKNK